MLGKPLIPSLQVCAVLLAKATGCQILLMLQLVGLQRLPCKQQNLQTSAAIEAYLCEVSKLACQLEANIYSTSTA